MTRYPVYVISKGRTGKDALTAIYLAKDNVPFHLVVEPQEYDAYAEQFGAERVYELPFSNLGLGSIPARNWVWEHAKETGAERHWILDDNMRGFYRRYKARRIRCHSGLALAACEDFVDRYENIAIGGLNYKMFVPDREPVAPFFLNCHVYSCLLIRNDLPYRWRGRYNEDTDLCLQVLANGWCTVTLNAFSVDKMPTMTMKGGNSDQLYQGDGRAKMARSLERVWPGVVSVDRRFRRPQHVIKGGWRYFDTPLKKKPKSEWPRSRALDMKLETKAEIKSPKVRELVRQFEAESALKR